jgi:hypothetical protein
MTGLGFLSYRAVHLPAAEGNGVREELGRIWARFRALAMWAQVPIGILAGLFAVAMVMAPFTEPEDEEEVDSSATTSTVVQTTTLPATTTTTLPSVPAGEDAAVSRVTDGDSLVASDGTRVRLIGIDAPDLETNDCFSSEAMNHLGQLAGPGTRVRLVFDAERLDRFGRTLATSTASRMACSSTWPLPETATPCN